MKGPINSYSMKWSCILHGVLLLSAVFVPMLPAFRPPALEVPMEFTVVLEDHSEAEPVKPAPKERKEDPLVLPANPKPLPDPPKEAVVIERKKKEPEKKKEPPKPEPEKKTFVKGKRVEKVIDQPVKPKEDFTKLRRAMATDKPLSRAEIEKALRDGAKVGTRNQIPSDELSRCIVLVKQALYEAWNQPGVSDAGARPVLLDIRLDGSGRIISYRIRQSSGSAYFDQTVLKAAANCAPIRGLSVAFLKQYETLSVEFKLE